ncbi:MAG: YifB family Mg chelatase-like AAA ATPase [Planctomycetota bacterium]
MADGRAHVARGAFLVGLDAREILVEVCVAPSGNPRTRIVGVPDSAVRESSERVRAAIRACGLRYPGTGVLVNLAPASLKKTGAAFDLPIALAILAATAQIPGPPLGEFLCCGELSLTGGIRPARGILPMLILARRLGLRGLLALGELGPFDGENEGVHLYPASHLREIVEFFAGSREIAPAKPAPAARCASSIHDLADVRGQRRAKKAVIAASAGGHNILLVGPPGTGKTLLLNRVADLLPPPTTAEEMDIACIYSVAGLPPPRGHRPVRAPHHTVSHAGLVGGGNPPLPGEITLAHRGVLLLDEFAEFARRSIESLRAPLEEGSITISRAGSNITFPCRFLLAATMNPCACGWRGHPRKACRCTPRQIEQYLQHLSGPILDRIDIQLELEPVTAADMEPGSAPAKFPTDDVDTSTARELVARAREIQAARYRGEEFSLNCELPVGLLRRYAPLSPEALRPLRLAMEATGLSARAYVRTVRIARTLADLRGAAEIAAGDVALATSFRCLDGSRRTLLHAQQPAS